jgi:hypothetical protein
MITAPHMLTGAAIGRTFNRWWLVVPLAFGSHFILDYIPHVETAVLFNIGDKPLLRVSAEAVSISLAVTLTLWVVKNQPQKIAMMVGAITATLIDLLENLPVVGHFMETSDYTSWLYSFHHGFHHSVPHSQWPLGLATQIAVTIFAIYVCRSRKTKQL